MTDNNTDKTFDVIIVGAGPAGCTAALALKESGLKVALFDKENFPRDKVCGDAIPAVAVKTLNKISPELPAALGKHEQLLLTRYTEIKYGRRILQLQWKIAAYTCPRFHFDNMLLEFVRTYTNTAIYLEAGVRNIERTDNGYRVTDKNGNTYAAELLVGADGAQGIVARKLADYTVDREHHIASVRAYYRDVEGVATDKTEMYMSRDFLPGYFWIFPVAGGMANVGFGMVSKDVADKKINLKAAFYEFIEATPELKHRFKNAEQAGKLEGYSLPAGSRRIVMSGDNFLLCGDAASLIDPITGEGIGNAVLSGYLAAQQIERCFNSAVFSASFMKQYEDEVWASLGSELKLHARGQRLFRRMPGLLNVAFALCRWEPVRKLVQAKF